MKPPALCFLFFTVALFLASCASAAKPPVSRIPEELPPPEVEEIDEVLRMVKTNSGGIRKYFTQDENRDIHVLGEPLPGIYAGDYEITYDLMNAFSPEAERLCVGFTLAENKTGTLRRDSLSWIIPADDSGVLLSFDDNYEEVWATWFDKLDEYGAKATFFVHEYSPFCESALARGHDIGYHSRNHLNLPKVSREIFYGETLEGLDEFRREGIPLAAFAYPFGLWEPWMHDELFQSFKALRGYGRSFRLYGLDALGGAYSSSTAVDNTLYKDDGDFKKTLLLMLRTAKFLGGVFPVTTHTISGEAQWGIKEERLIFLLETARQLKLTFYRYSDFSD